METMKQCATTSCSTESYPEASPIEKEIEVSQILLDLETLMSLTEYLRRFSWGRKRRRSCLDSPPILPSVLPPSVQRILDGFGNRGSQIRVSEEKADAAAPRTTASPDTPLSFSPSESDGKSKHSSKKKFRKRARDQYIDTIDALTQHKDLLTGEIENAKKYYSKLKAYNSKLKAMKQEMLNSCPRKEKPQMEMINLGMKFSQHYGMIHQQPLIADPRVQNYPYPYGPITTQLVSSDNGLGSANQMGPHRREIDLNLSPAEEACEVESSQPLDVNMALSDQRARYAEARRKRKEKLKIKATRNSCGIRLR